MSQNKSITIGLVLAGGSGTRLWPLSRQERPKQFLPLFGIESLFVQAVSRALKVCDQVVVVGAECHKHLIIDQLRLVANDTIANDSVIELYLEQTAANTAPAILKTLQLLQHEYANDTSIVVLSADHLISKNSGFETSIKDAKTLAEKGRLVCFGITPTEPHTGYGYLQVSPVEGELKIVQFIEKPVAAKAEAFLHSGNHYWNAGMFVGSIGTWLSEAQQTCPSLLAQLDALTEVKNDSLSGITSKTLPDFSSVPPISIDYALMEHAKKLACVVADFEWSDIGSLDAVAKLNKPDSNNNNVSGNATILDSTDCMVVAGSRKVALIGMKDTIVVDTADAVLVVAVNHAQNVRQLVEILKQDTPSIVTQANTSHRPWGSYTILNEGKNYKVKEITVLPDRSLSLQYHYHRSEHWVVIDGVATVTNGDTVMTLHPNESTFIPAEAKHRLENKTTAPLTIIEVQTGSYLGEDDIVRLEDRYRRT